MALPLANKKRKLEDFTADGGFISHLAVTFLIKAASCISCLQLESLLNDALLLSRWSAENYIYVVHLSYECVITAINLSVDGLYFVSGGDDGRVLMWPTNQVISGEAFDPNPMEMETKHGFEICCLALSLDNERIIKLLYFFTLSNRRKLFQSFEHGAP